MRELVKMPVRFYRAAISPLLAPRCRFSPTCSAYTLEAISRHGVLKGLFLGARRLGKCHPWSSCSAFHDPVPEAFDWAGLIGYKRPSSRGGNI